MWKLEGGQLLLLEYCFHRSVQRIGLRSMYSTDCKGESQNQDKHLRCVKVLYCFLSCVHNIVLEHIDLMPGLE